MNEKRPLTSEQIAEIVRGIEVDLLQLQILADLPAKKRLLPGMAAREFSMSALRGTFRKRYPDLSLSEINLKVLAYFTPLRMR
jgi:hypothetical protein